MKKFLFMILLALPMSAHAIGAVAAHVSVAPHVTFVPVTAHPVEVAPHASETTVMDSLPHTNNLHEWETTNPSPVIVRPVGAPSSTTTAASSVEGAPTITDYGPVKPADDGKWFFFAFMLGICVLAVIAFWKDFT